MVLNQNQQSGLKLNALNHMVLNIEHFQNITDIQKFESAVNLLNCINTIVWINKASSIDDQIKTDVLYKCIDSIFTGAILPDNDITDLFIQIKKIERFCDTMSKIVDTSMTSQGYQIPFEVLMAVQGLSFELRDELDMKTVATIHSQYGIIYSETVFGNMPISDYILKTNKLINDFKK